MVPVPPRRYIVPSFWGVGVRLLPAGEWVMDVLESQCNFFLERGGIVISPCLPTVYCCRRREVVFVR